ncbi:hypothetical protein BsWGS_10103 [Bradybaena similaris]
MTVKIFLGNLNSKTTAEQLRPLFEKYGEVVECDVLKNFGFVHMENKSDALKAIAQLDGHSIDGNNIRVELSTGKGGGGSGKFDRKGFGGNRPRPYGPPGRGDYDRHPYAPMPPAPAYDRYDPYYRYYMEREAYYSRMGPLGDRAGPAPRDSRMPALMPRDRLPERYAPDPRSYLDERTRSLPTDPYFREREPLPRPPPEYYERKQMSAAGRPELSGAATGRAGASGAYGNGVGDFYRGIDRAGASLGGGAGGDYFRQGGSGRSGLGGDSQSSFAQDGIFF